jgi:YidC/Oxa1 family membrane protein insertase
VAELSAEKRILLAFGLSFLVLVVWSKFFLPAPPPPAEETPPPVTEPAPEPVAPPAPAQRAAQPLAQAPLETKVRQGSVERFLTVETETSTIVFSTTGASVRSWRLKEYDDDDSGPVELVQGHSSGLGYPLTFALADPEREAKLNGALFVPSVGTEILTAPVDLAFEWSDGNLVARKRFRFEREYLAWVETEIFEAGQPLEHRLAWRGGFGESNQQAVAMAAGGQVFVRGPEKLLKQAAKDAGRETGWLWKSASPFPYSGEASYAGIDDRYFAALFMPQRPHLVANAWTQQGTPPEQEKPQSVGEIAIGVLNGNRLQLFVGPKDIDLLREMEAPALANGTRPDLADELVDFGWFWWVAKPLFAIMKWTYRNVVSNYGWVIVLLTVVINVVLFPLRWKSMQSSFKMQQVAPQIKVIQDRYKQYKFNDPRKQQMQQEIMAVYKQQGINPVGGCLPLLFQLPFFYGFYKVLLLSIEMRHAPWILWITDLSQKDPVYVLPISMAATMYLSMSVTPMTGDPRQKRMMQVMMLVFGFMFLQVSAGLVLYWLSSSVVGLVQQYWMLRHHRKHEEAEKQAARARKKKKKRKGQEGERE